MQVEEWKNINGFENYKASSLGKVRRFSVLKPSQTYRGYLIVGLYANRVKKTLLVHRIIAKAFIPNPKNLPEVNHKNGIKTDNRVVNLEWVTSSYNSIHSLKNGLQKPLRGNDHPGFKVSEERVTEIRSLFRTGKFTQISLGNKFGIAQQTVSKIINNKARYEN